jgi:hypothetical protein
MGRASNHKRASRPQRGTFYHFTCESNAGGIVAAGAILANSPTNHRWTDPLGRPVVWLLDTPTADHRHGLDLGAVDKRTVRFTVRATAVRWLDWMRSQRDAQPGFVAAIIATGGGLTAASHWWVSFEDIPQADWRAVHQAHQRAEAAA